MSKPSNINININDTAPKLAAHTPGPWTMKTNTTTTPAQPNAQPVTAVMYSSRAAALIRAGRVPAMLRERDALLAALEAVVEEADAEHGGVCAQPDPLIEAARAAIGLATAGGERGAK